MRWVVVQEDPHNPVIAPLGFPFDKRKSTSDSPFIQHVLVLSIDIGHVFGAELPARELVHHVVIFLISGANRPQNANSDVSAHGPTVSAARALAAKKLTDPGGARIPAWVGPAELYSELSAEIIEVAVREVAGGKRPNDVGAHIGG